ncbi:D-alanyl-D-alanine carboxypeptidase [Pedobacter sp. SD-b]|uniref:D-alanyl-D-alanine carboxypeptidase n=1 Tax=Pedobacter segetis TaxID=2793069 RepID=A0ABS1BLE9_9SPHI|nr:D-alanyl-D-alanine carboxypeptidase [Pedobacter segetis]MBK0383718.1 D-alanyl-D-alanine carboxypeptidase [Pedobacter segetis]
MKKFFGLAAVIFTLNACTVKKATLTPYQNIADLIENSAIGKNHHVGFAIKEVGASKNMYEKNANLYFIPASNTKLFTFYTALNMLGDSVPSFQYIFRKDSLILWPMADASFLHPDFKAQKSFDFIKDAGKDVYLVTGRYHGEKYGKGWSWDDFNEYYQTEINDMPIYGNAVDISCGLFGKLKYTPDLAALYLNEVSISNQLKTVKRGLNNNNWIVPTSINTNYRQSLPLSLNKTIVENLLSDTLLATGAIVKPIETLNWRKVPQSANIIYGVASDTLYKHLLLPSDNFIAEELLLNCAAANKMDMNTDSVIYWASANLLNDMPNKIKWVDGSGLSRLNLFTPDDMVLVLQKIRDKINNDDRLFSLLPAGGESGTLKDMFKGSTAPYIFAKSGSLTNNYNLSGYLIGKSGKKYIFSFMNNGFVISTKEIKDEVVRVLSAIHDNY